MNVQSSLAPSFRPRKTFSYDRPSTSSTLSATTRRGNNGNALLGGKEVSASTRLEALAHSKYAHRYSNSNTLSSPKKSPNNKSVDTDYYSTSSNGSFRRRALSTLYGRYSTEQNINNSYSVNNMKDITNRAIQSRERSKSQPRARNGIYSFSIEPPQLIQEAIEDYNSSDDDSNYTNLPTSSRSQYLTEVYSSSSDEEYYIECKNNNKFTGIINNGLKNIGNTCYMNSTIQCLMSIETIRVYFTQDISKVQFKINPSRTGALVIEFCKLANNLTNESGESVAPLEFKKVLNQYTSLFRGYEQQDSQEFLRYLLDGLHEDLNRITVKPKWVELVDIPNESVIQKSNRWYYNYIERNNSFITDLFLGQLKSSITCTKCNKESINFDPFMDISLPIDFKSSRSYFSRLSSLVSVDECLKYFTTDELLTKADQVYCSSCAKHTDCRKTLSFFRLPKILVIQLKRFSNNEKLLNEVSVNIDDLVFDKYIDKEAKAEFYKKEKVKYHLLAVIRHYGSLRGGHYLCNARISENEWVEYNDSKVKKLAKFCNTDSSAYILFYGLS
ncbi:hypothetical protein ABK040_005434 [Willaertia magna]